MVQILQQDNYRVAIDLARQVFASQDPFRQAQRCGGRLEKSDEGTLL